MDKYLLELLKEVKTIIIPGLGALSLIDEATGDIMFMPYLKHDDGTLARHIASRENMSENDARNLVSRYVREIEGKLAIGESYDMYRFGSFQKDAAGEISFLPWKEMAAVEDKRHEPALEPPVNGNEEIPATAEDEYVAEPKKEESQYTVQEERPKEIYTEQQQWEDDLDLPPINARVVRPKKPILEKAEPDRKDFRRPVIYITLAVIVLLIGGTLTYAVFYNSFSKPHDGKPVIARKSHQQEKPESIKVTDTEPGVNKDTTTSNSVQHNPSPQTEIDVNSQPVSGIIRTSTGEIDPAKPYHVIGGAFSDLNNAERYRDKLADMGRSSVIIGRFDRLYLVSMASHPSNEAARDALKDDHQISARAWIFRWP